MRDLQTGATRQLTDMAADGGKVSDEPLAISHDGKFVAFFGYEQDERRPGLRLVPLTGGVRSAPRLLAEGDEIVPLGWMAHDQALLVRVNRGAQSYDFADIAFVTVNDGSLRALKTVPYWSLGGTSASPNGRVIAYDVPSNATSRQRTIFLAPTDGGAEEPVVEASSAHVIGWSPGGQYLLFAGSRGVSSGLWALRLSGGKRVAEPELLRSGWHGDPLGITSQGELFYARAAGPPTARLFVSALDLSGRAPSTAPQLVAKDRQWLSHLPLWSTDGGSFMYVTSHPAGPTITIRSTDGSSEKEIPLNLDYVRTFDWSPDRRSLLFCGAIDVLGETGIFIVDATTGDVRRTLEVQRGGAGRASHPVCQFSIDGRSVLAFKRDLDTGRWSIVALDLAAGAERQLYAVPKRFLNEHRYPAGRSPDGRFLLAVDVDEPESGLFAYDTTTEETREVFRIKQPNAFYHYGVLPWMPGGRSVVANVKADHGRAREMWWISLDGREPRRLDLGVSDLVDSAIAVSPDGTQVAFVSGHVAAGVLGLFPDPKLIGAGVEFRVLENFLPAISEIPR